MTSAAAPAAITIESSLPSPTAPASRNTNPARKNNTPIIITPMGLLRSDMQIDLFVLINSYFSAIIIRKIKDGELRVSKIFHGL